MTIIRTRHDRENPYFTLNRTVVNDARLSYRAVGIHTYLMSKPDHWSIRETDLINRHTEGQHAVRTALKELRTFGYLVTVKLRDEKTGKMVGSETHIHETPQPFNVEISDMMENPHVGKTTGRKINPIVINEEVVSNEDLVINQDPIDSDQSNLRSAVVTVLEQTWLTVNIAQIDNHMAIAERYGFAAWVRGWNNTPLKNRANKAYVEKVTLSHLSEEETSQHDNTVKVKYGTYVGTREDGSVDVTYQKYDINVPERYVKYLGTEDEQKYLSILVTRKGLGS